MLVFVLCESPSGVSRWKHPTVLPNYLSEYVNKSGHVSTLGASPETCTRTLSLTLLDRYLAFSYSETTVSFLSLSPSVSPPLSLCLSLPLSPTPVSHLLSKNVLWSEQKHLVLSENVENTLIHPPS